MVFPKYIVLLYHFPALREISTICCDLCIQQVVTRGTSHKLDVLCANNNISNNFITKSIIKWKLLLFDYYFYCETMLFIVRILFILFISLVSSQYIPQSPCPGTFDYTEDGVETFGKITFHLRQPSTNVNTRVNFTISAPLPSVCISFILLLVEFTSVFINKEQVVQ